MAETTSDRSSISRLILVPAVSTLVVTVLRLIGELQQWSEVWFNPTPGGAGALIGIVWLAPIFGIYFALKLSATSAAPVGKSIGLALVGVAIIACTAIVVGMAFGEPGSLASILMMNAAAAIGGVIQLYGWTSLSKVLLAYGLAARIPVVVVMFFAIRGNWGTHYDGPPPAFPQMGWVGEFLWAGLLPQLVFWIAFTMITGSLFGSIAAAIAHRRRATLQAA